MRILITGGAGFIGSHIQDAYLQEGHEVAIVDSLVGGTRENIHQKSKFYEIDIRSKEIEAVFKDFSPEIINLHAAQMDVRKSVQDPVFDCDVNAIGMLNLLENARKYNVKKVIFASSGGAVYGEQEYFPADEKHPTNPKSPYGITKLLGDKYLEFYQDTYGLNFVSLRYGNVFGPRQNPHGEAGVVAIFCSKLLKGELPTINGDGKQTRDYVYVKDVVRANLLALGENANGIFNIGTGQETNVLQIFEQLKNSLNVQEDAIHGPAKAGEQLRSVLSFQKIHDELGWSPQYSFADGIKETANYFKG